MSAKSSLPVIANFDARHMTIGSGAAIFHVKSERVVLCYHTKEKYWFLPKGRRDANEESKRAAEREGFEESGYPNRALPLPIDHRQPRPHKTIDEVDLFSAEPVWTQLVPVTPKGQYLLFWYICETLSPEDEAAFLLSRVQVSDDKEKDEKEPSSFARDKLPTPPQFTFAIPPYPQDLTLEERIKLEPEGWEPTRVEGTGVDEDEAMYVSYLLSVPQALERLKGSLSASVVSKGLELIHLRKQMEKEKAEMVAQKSTQE